RGERRRAGCMVTEGLIMRRPAIQTPTEGLGKLIADVRTLRSEVQKLNDKLGSFRRAGKQPITLPPEAGGSSYRAGAKTEEPRSAIWQHLVEQENSANVEVFSRAVHAIAKDIDGTLRDIRAARLALE